MQPYRPHSTLAQRLTTQRAALRALPAVPRPAQILPQPVLATAQPPPACARAPSARQEPVGAAAQAFFRGCKRLLPGAALLHLRFSSAASSDSKDEPDGQGAGCCTLSQSSAAR